MERMQAEQADFDRRQAEEAAREKGKDLFQNQLDASGKVVSITAKGDVSCPADSYDRVATWSFVPDFPTLDEQDEMVSLQPDSKQAAQRAAAQRARRRMAYKPPSNGFTFAFEGDDAVVDYDAAAGEMQTRAGKTFMIDKKGNESDVAIWQEYPAYFHYRCEQATSSCTLNRAGSAVLHATLKR